MATTTAGLAGVRSPLLLVVVLAGQAVVLSGCLGPAGDSVAPSSTGVPPPIGTDAVADPVGPLVEILTDAAGDAYESNSDAARDTARLGVFFGCVVTSLVRRDVFEQCWHTANPYRFGEDAPRAGTPADAAFDVRGVSMAASGSTFVVELDLGRMAEALDWIGESGVVYQVCWDSPEPWTYNNTLCDHAVVLWFEPIADGSPAVLRSAFFDRRPECVNGWPLYGCFFPVPHELLPGSPGGIRWEIPRSLMGNETLIKSPFAITQRSTRLSSEAFTDIWFNTPPPLCCEPCPCYTSFSFFESIVDDTAHGADFALPALRPGEVRAMPGTLGFDAADDLLFEGPRDVDILATTVVEGADTLTLAIQLATVAETPVNHVVWGSFALPGRAFNAGVRYHGEEVGAQGRGCWAKNIEGYCARSTDIRFAVARDAGTPGWVNFSFARSDLGFPVAGDTVHSVFSEAYVIERMGEAPAGAPTSYLVQPVHGLDLGNLAPTMRLLLGEPPRTTEGVPVAEFVEDEQYDVNYPGFCLRAECDRLDILYAQIVAESPTEAAVSIGLADLSQVRVPPGYHAVVYAAGLRTANGQTMVGYFRSEDNPGTFLCAPDTLVHVGSPLDPEGVVWTTIRGAVSQSQSAQGVGQGGRSTAGAITFQVPHDCLGKREPGALHVEAFGAGTFLIRNPAKQPGDGIVQRVDTVLRDEPLSVASVAPPVPPLPPWYARDLFWNIFGAFLAVLTVLVTVAIFAKRRRLMRWYLDELSRIDEHMQTDAQARARAIVALRKRLHRDILRHRVPDSEYIRDRLRGSLTSARLVSLSEGYYELPVSVAIRLERTLDDGRLTVEEQRLIEQVMARTKIPPKEKAVLAERLRSWAEEDKTWG